MENGIMIMDSNHFGDNLQHQVHMMFYDITIGREPEEFMEPTANQMENLSSYHERQMQEVAQARAQVVEAIENSVAWLHATGVSKDSMVSFVMGNSRRSSKLFMLWEQPSSGGGTHPWSAWEQSQKVRDGGDPADYEYPPEGCVGGQYAVAKPVMVKKSWKPSSGSGGDTLRTLNEWVGKHSLGWPAWKFRLGDSASYLDALIYASDAEVEFWVLRDLRQQESRNTANIHRLQGEIERLEEAVANWRDPAYIAEWAENQARALEQSILVEQRRLAEAQQHLDRVSEELAEALEFYGV